jgi:hypothetical protein
MSTQPTGPARPPVWQPAPSRGEGEIFRGFGGIVSPLLAGFSLSTVAILLTSDRPIALLGLPVAAFTLSTVLSLFAIQVSITALRYTASPSDRLDWTPEASRSEEELQQLRWEQAMDMAVVSAYSRRLQLCFDLAVLAFILGLILLIAGAKATVGTALALGFAIAGGTVELLWWLSVSRSRRFARLARWLQPIRRPLAPVYQDVLDGVSQRWSAEWEDGAMLSAVLDGRPVDAPAPATPAEGPSAAPAAR